ncbi:MAG: Mur ligase family protein, partial [Vicinamibacteria bacterium]
MLDRRMGGPRLGSRGRERGSRRVGSHATLDDYIAAKARLWKDQTEDQVAIGNADDPVVSAQLA